MSLNFDCYSLISKYLNDFDHLNFCGVFSLEVDINNLTKGFIERYMMELYGMNIDLNKVLKDLDWYSISMHGNLSEDFLRQFKHYVHWQNVSTFQQLSENFMIEFENYIDWNIVSQNQKISSTFARQFKHRLNWRAMSECQKLPEEFIREFENYVDWSCIYRHQAVSEQFMIEFQDKIGLEIIPSPKKIRRSCSVNGFWIIALLIFFIIFIPSVALSNNLFEPISLVFTFYCVVISFVGAALLWPPIRCVV